MGGVENRQALFGACENVNYGRDSPVSQLSETSRDNSISEVC